MITNPILDAPTSPISHNNFIPSAVGPSPKDASRVEVHKTSRFRTPHFRDYSHLTKPTLTSAAFQVSSLLLKITIQLRGKGITAKLAQSRPTPVRVHTTTGASPPPLSPRTNGEKEKKHHTWKKSSRGETYVVSEKKSGRPTPLSKRSTPQYITKVGNGHSSSGRQREKEREDEERGRDSGESFPQFW